MRNAFADELTSIAAADDRVVLLSGDIGNQLFDRYKAKAKPRFFNCGVAEANMMSVAAGLALCGLRPVVYTITPFTTTRCLEQIRVDVCYHDLPVVIVGTGSGMSYAELGPTHHSCEDMALLRVLPGMTVLAPCDPTEVRLALRAAMAQSGPVYMRIGKKGEPAVHQTPPSFRIGKAITLRSGGDVCLLATGTVVPTALAAAQRLGDASISARVDSFHTIKPLDTALLEDAFDRFPLVATVEEHSRLGGLGGSVAEWLAARGPSRTRLLAFGTDDVFMHETGTQDYARRRFGLTAESIADRIRTALAARVAA